MVGPASGWDGGSLRDQRRSGRARSTSVGSRANCTYKRPSFYEDLIGIEVEVCDVRPASFWFSYRVVRGEDLLAEGYTRHAVIGADGRPKRIPDVLRAAIPPAVKPIVRRR